MMGMVARQFGHPRGVLGRIVGRGMVRSNGDFSRWTIGELRRHLTWVPTRIVELGPGPGVGLEELLGAFPDAKVWGVDPSREMLGLSRQRNAAAAEGGRLALLEGGVASLVEVAPVDIVAANHVLYFWQEPEAELRRIRGSLRSGGLLAIGYQLRQNMPAIAQKQFPRQGYRLYGTNEEVNALLRSAGFAEVVQSVKGSPEQPEGWLAMATGPPEPAIGRGP
jgi:trans-aconitate methyltransferase